MGSASTLVHPDAVARRGREPGAKGAPHWWRGLLLAALLGGSGAWVRGCHTGEPTSCDRNDTAPEGTRFRVEVLEELPDSTGCLALEPGSVFFLTAGATVEGSRGVDCNSTLGSGPPEGLETGYEYTRCEPLANLGAWCEVAQRDLCPEVPNPGYVRFVLRSTGEFLLDQGPSEGEFYVEDGVLPECTRSRCLGRYRIRISRVMEE